MTTSGKHRQNKLPETDIYCITSEEHSKGGDNIDIVKQMIQADIKIIQFREKEMHMGEKYEQCLKIRDLTREAGVFFIVNDNVDLAMLVDADGIHIGQEDLPIEAVRQLVGDDMVIGLSTHSPDQAEDAVKRGADYIGVGPIFQTDTKKDVCDPVGFNYLDHVISKRLDIPFVTIGGIKAHNVGDVVTHGATCVALVTEIVGAEDIGKKIKEVRQVMGTSR
ncbi:MAG: thiamine phosphate synthase [Desulfobacterales bacterium]|nr:thiamine phosphate synthase [Desulfobacterales bacterium]